MIFYHQLEVSELDCRHGTRVAFWRITIFDDPNDSKTGRRWPFPVHQASQGNHRRKTREQDPGWCGLSHFHSRVNFKITFPSLFAIPEMTMVTKGASKLLNLGATGIEILNQFLNPYLKKAEWNSSKLKLKSTISALTEHVGGVTVI